MKKKRKQQSLVLGRIPGLLWDDDEWMNDDPKMFSDFFIFFLEIKFR